MVIVTLLSVPYRLFLPCVVRQSKTAFMRESNSFSQKVFWICPRSRQGGRSSRERPLQKYYRLPFLFFSLIFLTRSWLPVILERGLPPRAEVLALSFFDVWGFFLKVLLEHAVKWFLKASKAAHLQGA